MCGCTNGIGYFLTSCVGKISCFCKADPPHPSRAKLSSQGTLGPKLAPINDRSPLKPPSIVSNTPRQEKKKRAQKSFEKNLHFARTQPSAYPTLPSMLRDDAKAVREGKTLFRNCGNRFFCILRATK